MNFAIITDLDNGQETVINLDRINIIEATRDGGSVVYMADGGQIRFKKESPSSVVRRLVQAVLK